MDKNHKGGKGGGNTTKQNSHADTKKDLMQ